MAALDNRYLDASLIKLTDEATHLFLCSANPNLDFALATVSYALANASPVPWGVIEDRPGGGRRISIQPFTGGAWTAAGTAAFYAIVDAVSERVLLSGALSPTTAGAIGQSISLTTAFYPLSLPGV